MAPVASTSLGNILQRLRLAAALSQETLAERSGVSARAISDIERGLRSAPRLETMRMLADGLALSDADRAEFLQASRAQKDDVGTSYAAESEQPERATRQSSRFPAPPTALIGREVAVDQIRSLVIDDRARIVTLTGPGGVGKTRLVLAVAEALAPEFGDQVAWVDVASLSDPLLVPSAIATAVGIRDTGNVPLIDALTSYFRVRTFLLVIDNFEHLLQAGTALADIAQQCPGLTMLVTSREPLRLRGEREVPVPPLRFPETETQIGIEEIGETAAVALFVERARQVRPDFELTSDNARYVAEICRKLDGLPLAIELAAARVRLLPPSALLTRLDHRLGVLTVGARDAPERQRTLRDTIAWSYDLLSLDEQLFFRRLSIFVNGFMLEGAEAVAAIPGQDSLDLLTMLVEKSLVQAAPFEGGEVRFRMLETIREFGLERLAEDVGEEEAVCQKHFDYLLALTESFFAESKWGWASGDVDWYRRLDAEIDNIRGVLAWNLERGAGEPYLRLAVSLSPYITTRPITEEAVEFFLTGLAVAPDAEMELRLTGMFMAGMFLGSLGRVSEAFAMVDSAVAVASAEGDPLLIGIAQSLAGMHWEAAGDCERSVQSYRLGLEAFRRIPPSGWLYITLCELGDKLAVCGDIEEAVALLDEAARGFEVHSERWGTAMVLQQRGHAAVLQVDLELARTFFQQSIDAAREVSDLRLELGAVLGVAALTLADGRPEAAARIVGAVEQARESNGIGRTLPYPIHNDRVISLLREQVGPEDFDSLVLEGRGTSYEDLVTESLNRFDLRDESSMSARNQPGPN